MAKAKVAIIRVLISTVDAIHCWVLYVTQRLSPFLSADQGLVGGKEIMPIAYRQPVGAKHK